MSVESLKNEGNALLAANNVEGALHRYDQALAIDPKNHICLSNKISVLLLRLQRPVHELLPLCDLLESLQPTWFRTLQRRAQCLFWEAMSISKEDRKRKMFVAAVNKLRAAAKQAETEQQKKVFFFSFFVLFYFFFFFSF